MRSRRRGPTPSGSASGGPSPPGSWGRGPWVRRTSHARAAAPAARIGHTTRHDRPTPMSPPAAAAPHRAPELKSAWNRTSAPGRPTRRRVAAAFIAVSTQPAATSAAQKHTAKLAQFGATPLPTNRTAHAARDHESIGPVPQRSAPWLRTPPVSAGSADRDREEKAQLRVAQVERPLDVGHRNRPGAPERAEADEREDDGAGRGGERARVGWRPPGAQELSERPVRASSPGTFRCRRAPASRGRRRRGWRRRPSGRSP